MTNTYIHLNKPFLLRAVGKDYLWGGQRLNTEYNKNIDMNPLAETWECSTHPDGLSYVDSGEFINKTLKEVLNNHPEFLGTHPKTKNGEIPILIKFIDAKQDLSIQVHPSDEYALKNENGQLGKTEMWYVLDTTEDAKLIYGFNNNVSKEIIVDAINKNKLEKYLNFIDVKKEDVFYIEAGTVHAICAGSLIVEIQENSNLTYRLYDYNRKDKNGELRELHIDKALDVINYKMSKNYNNKISLRKYSKGYYSELLCRCKYYEVHKEIIRTDHIFNTNGNSFHVLVCTEGNGHLYYDNEEIEISKGKTIFVPANSVDIKIEGKLILLNINC